MIEKDKYKRLLIEAGLFFSGHNKGSFILPPLGYTLWKNMQNILDNKFAARGVKNVFLPTLIPFNLLEKEKNHIAGFSPECFWVERMGEKKLTEPLALRPTSEVLFYDWYRQILQSYQQLPFLYNQWCSVFRAEKNTAPFFRNTEFLWQEGHTIHHTAKEAREFALSIFTDYQDYAENILDLGVIVGQKSEGEKFAGAVESYTVECLLPDGQCLQLATSHYFGDDFCRLLKVQFQDEDNHKQYPFSTSWGTSTRAIGAVVKTHADNWGVILPWEIAPVQIAFVLVEPSEELFKFYQEINGLLSTNYRCQLYNKSSRVNWNILQADREGCPFKIILGSEELKKEEITLVRRDNIEQKITISLTIQGKEQEFLRNSETELTKNFEKYDFLEDKSREETIAVHKKSMDLIKNGFKRDKIIKVIEQEVTELEKKSAGKKPEFRDKHIFSADNFAELEKKISAGNTGLFLIPFCNKLDCEKRVKDRIPSYSIRCLDSNNKEEKSVSKCLFCQAETRFQAYLGRSY